NSSAGTVRGSSSSAGTKITGASQQESMKSSTKISKKTLRGLPRWKQAKPISSATFLRMKWSDLNLTRGFVSSRCRDCGRSFLFLVPAYKPLDNPKVRRAMTHAIDRDRIIKLVLEGNAYPLRGLLGPQVFGYDPEARAYPYDPEKAKQLLVEAGFSNGFEIDYYSPTGRYPKDREVAQVIVEHLSKVGIKANLKTPEWSIFNTDYKNGKYAFYLTGRGSLTDADTLFQQYFRTGMTKRVLGYSNPKLDEILDAEQQMFDVKKRAKLLWEAHRIILEDAPAIPLWNAMDIYAYRADLVWTPPPDEKVHLKQAYFKSR